MRNPIIANVFLRLNYIEAFGTGVARIRAAYEGSAAKPKFSVTENTICVELPVVTEEVALTDDEKRALALFEEGKEVSRRDLEGMLGMSQTKAGRVLKSLFPLPFSGGRMALACSGLIVEKWQFLGTNLWSRGSIPGRMLASPVDPSMRVSIVVAGTVATPVNQYSGS